MVAWARRATGSGVWWLRWESPPLTTLAQWEDAWQQAALWAQNPGDAERRREVPVTPLADWQVFYYRNDAWTNAFSSDAGAVAPPPGAGSAAVPTLPDGVRLVLTLPPGQAVSGTLQRDWVNPTAGGGKS
ncbi:hypothetical protein [Xylophilus sp. ASV27]|uniref:hypothetical protein n=1 Tax=Xylophilus sp. ASV27 TaxID=2795129 RepID=UPI0018ED5CFE|nr:hypothetical protein [Xylophilus sp. ASV27]